jgi:hypothetical protein
MSHLVLIIFECEGKVLQREITVYIVVGVLVSGTVTAGHWHTTKTVLKTYNIEHVKNIGAMFNYLSMITDVLFK